MNTNITSASNRQHGKFFCDGVPAKPSAPRNVGATPIPGSPDRRTLADDAVVIERALTKLRASSGHARWMAQLPWRVRELVDARPHNLYYALRGGPFPSQILQYRERDQMCSLTVFVHSVHSPRVVFDVPARDLRPYHELPRDWQLLLHATFPPLFDLSKLPPSALEADLTNHDEGYGPKQYRRSDRNKDALRALSRIGRWLFW